MRLMIVGAGSRGLNYATLAHQSGRANVVAVAEPDETRRTLFARQFGLDPSMVFSSWPEALTHPRVADAVVIATPDNAHVEPAIAFADAGFHILLEKPMAPTEAESLRIVEAVERNRVMLQVCHVLRYSSYTKMVKDIIDRGDIGDIVSIEHLEPIGWWHFAHSYVRGNWRNEESSSPMILAKSSHDLDWLSYIVDQPITRVSSFGGLRHFTPANKPVDAANRCLDCPLIASCAYSAPKIYSRFLGDPVGERWPLSVLSTDVSADGLHRALETGPYGECVYNGQNDVADHQVVNFELRDGATISFTVTAFTELDFRKTRIFGTLGSIEGDGRRIELTDFRTAQITTRDVPMEGGASAADGHGGADAELISHFLDTLESGDVDAALRHARQSLYSHQLAWAAEKSRHTGAVLTLDPPR
ncbi:Gfo/Idh/MocA family protein [Mycetocola zhadangensis]|uniref:Gfo/Idh/MocA family oxidoreductase n=1 Tax=Mycetocola zhadangensis TaxID=1164595 RepID=A0A3L7IX35_9MICO|nr:Gfo/Idh/MocA family oxidoreductase [Mycetocola zhadangensis]RLQ82703.1 gfo/Idh/MocA family oxidoreductase [Mycetocola zhadangensis]GGE98950.1 oxidoreductase [Mycetocola zhadangensis]